jgi:hypothetical protein
MQVCLLLQRMGLDASDTRPIRKANLSGAELLLLSEQQLVTLLDVPMHKAHRLMRLQVRREGYTLYSWEHHGARSVCLGYRRIACSICCTDSR